MMAAAILAMDFTPQAATGLFILVAVVAIVLYDLAVYLLYGEDATISLVARRAGERWPLLAPLVAFALGCLYGHIFLSGPAMPPPQAAVAPAAPAAPAGR